MMIPRAWLLVAVLSGAGMAAENKKSADPASAREVVREGNRQLLAGNAHAALDAYQQARTIVPDAPEVSFVEGLGHYHLKDYAKARQSFEQAATASNPALVDDALYSVGTTYHAEALEESDHPEAGIEKLESAIQRYQGVLAGNPQHEFARDAYLKAASLRRQYIQQMQQQKQEKQNKKDGSKKGDEKKDDEKKESNEQQDRSEEKQQTEDQRQAESQNKDEQENQEKKGQQQQDQEQQKSEQSQEKQSQNEQSQESQKEPSSSESQSSEKDQQDDAQRQARDSREQAERRLREMMQAVRDRQKQRRETLQRVPVAPVDKDW